MISPVLSASAMQAPTGDCAGLGCGGWQLHDRRGASVSPARSRTRGQRLWPAGQRHVRPVLRLSHPGLRSSRASRCRASAGCRTRSCSGLPQLHSHGICSIRAGAWGSVNGKERCGSRACSQQWQLPCTLRIVALAVTRRRCVYESKANHLPAVFGHPIMLPPATLPCFCFLCRSDSPALRLALCMCTCVSQRHDLMDRPHHDVCLPLRCSAAVL